MRKYRIVRCDYLIGADKFVVLVDLDHKLYIVQIPRINAIPVEAFQEHVEKDILSQQQGIPDYTGLTWEVQT